MLEATANYEEAVREYQAAIAINGNIPDLHLQLGINYSALGIYDQAVQEFSNANALNPADPMPDYLTSRTYATVGEYAKARQYAETAVTDEPTSARYHGNLGVMYYHTALFSDAVKELALAVNGGITGHGQEGGSDRAGAGRAANCGDLLHLRLGAVKGGPLRRNAPGRADGPDSDSDGRYCSVQRQRCGQLLPSPPWARRHPRFGNRRRTVRDSGRGSRLPETPAISPTP